MWPLALLSSLAGSRFWLGTAQPLHVGIAPLMHTGSLVNDSRRYFSQSADLTFLDPMSSEITEQQADRIPAGVNVNASRYRSPMARLIVFRRDALAETGQVERASDWTRASNW
ncbi:MAG TPA: hypothetical protein VL485_23775 [Ktedonobacteraceae bacterium]|nr:hypothetical protein [Ktedonobacteraceae bacterium]